MLIIKGINVIIIGVRYFIYEILLSLLLLLLFKLFKLENIKRLDIKSVDILYVVF